MANFLRLQLRNGTFQGKTVIAPSALQETRTPQIVNNPGNPPGYYGLGWNVGTDTSGRLRLNHSGAFNVGAATVISFYPSQDVGIVVLSNSFPIGVPEALSAGFYDLLFHGNITNDWVALYGQFYAGFWKSIRDLYPVYPPPPVPAVLARPLALYTGTYANDLYGGVEVVPSGRGLAIRLGPRQVTYQLGHYNGDLFTFLPVGENAFATSGARFKFGRQGPASTLTIDYYNAEGLGTLSRFGMADPHLDRRRAEFEPAGKRGDPDH
jgi:hypothetical protein